MSPKQDAYYFFRKRDILASRGARKVLARPLALDEVVSQGKFSFSSSFLGKVHSLSGEKREGLIPGNG